MALNANINCEIFINSTWLETRLIAIVPVTLIFIKINTNEGYQSVYHIHAFLNIFFKQLGIQTDCCRKHFHRVKVDTKTKVVSIFL